MIKLQDIYALPFVAIRLNNWFFGVTWLPELPFPDLDEAQEAGVLAAIHGEQRLVVREHIGEERQQRRDAGLHTLWFDGAPVAIVKSNGYWDRKNVTRWITNQEAFLGMLGYLHSKMIVPDVVSPDTEIFEEEVFMINGNDFSQELGHRIAPVMPGFLVVPAEHMYLVQVPESIKEIPRFIRRGACVLEFKRLMTPEEHAANPWVRTRGEENGVTRYPLYSIVPRPHGVEILSV